MCPENGNRPGEGAACSATFVEFSLNDAGKNTLAPLIPQADPVEVVVAPVGGGRFSAQLGGRVIVESSRQPLLAAARVLVAEGADPRSRIAMRHAGANHVALRSTISVAARLTVEESNRGRPTLAPWEPFRSPAVPSPLGFLRDPYPWRGEPHPAVGWMRRAAR